MTADSIERATQSLIAWGIFFGLVIGKPLGIMLASLTAARIKVAELPEGVSTS